MQSVMCSSVLWLTMLLDKQYGSNFLKAFKYSLSAQKTWHFAGNDSAV